MIDIKLKQGLIGLIIISIIGAVFIFRQSLLPTPAAKVKVAQVQLEELLNKHPDWGKYQNLQAELNKLEQNWTKKIGDSPSSWDSAGNETEALQRQTDEIQQAYSDEAKVKLANLNKTLEEYTKNRQNQAALLYKEKVDTLNDRLTKEMKARAEVNNEALSRARAKIQADYQVTLSNLQLQLTIAELALNPQEHQGEKEKIQAEIDRLNREIEDQVRVEYEKLLTEYNRFVEQRKTEMSKELEAYQNQLRQEMSADIKEYQEKLEHEFTTWQQKREAELQNAVKSRNEQLSKEYKQYTSERQVLQAQLDQIKDNMLWDVKTAVKQMARAEAVDLVVTGDLARLQSFDWTSKLAGALFENK